MGLTSVVLDAAVGVPASVTSVEATIDGLGRVGQAIGQGATRHEVRVAVDIGPVQVGLGDVRKQDRGLPGANRSSGRTAWNRIFSLADTRESWNRNSRSSARVGDRVHQRRCVGIGAVACLRTKTNDGVASRKRWKRPEDALGDIRSLGTGLRVVVQVKDFACASKGVKDQRRRMMLEENSCDAHSSISPDSAVHVSIASCSTSRSQALTKSCRDALENSARRSTTNTCKRILLHVHRAIRSLRRMEAGQLAGHLSVRRGSRRDVPVGSPIASTNGCDVFMACGHRSFHESTSYIISYCFRWRDQHSSRSRKDGEHVNAQRA